MFGGYGYADAETNAGFLVGVYANVIKHESGCRGAGATGQTIQIVRVYLNAVKNTSMAVAGLMQ